MGRGRVCSGVARLADAGGQSTVEIVGLLPILVAVVLGAAQLLAAGVAGEVADHAAEAGALAILQGGARTLPRAQTSPRDQRHF